MKLNLVVLAALLLSACNRPTQNTEAVRQGVVKHLTGKAGLDVGSMQVDVTSVTFRDNEADAVVSFKPKGSSDPSNAMQMRYTLERKGSEWVVKGKSEAGGAPHGGTGMGAPGGAGAMPPGHPAVPSAPQQSTPEQKK